VRGFGLAVPRQQQQGARKPLLARVEELVDEILFDADIPCHHVGQKAIRERRTRVQLAHHVRLFDAENCARRHSRRRRHSVRLACQTALAEEMAGVEHSNHGFLAGVRHD
jgi:hypothetical protein